MSKTNHGRRQFIQASLLTALLVPFLGAFRSVLAAKKAQAPLPAGATEVQATDAVASAIGYKPNVQDIDYAKYPQRKKADAAHQFCKSCALFTPTNDSWGKCQMLTSGMVRSEGWCASWSKKA